MRLVLVLFTAATLCGCARYGDFTLPPLAGTTAEVHFNWQPRDQPVLSHGAPGEWDSNDALNPSVVLFHGTYLNVYSGFNGKAWSTGVATSSDGLIWQKHGSVLTPDRTTWEGDYIAANGAAIVNGSDSVLYFYQGGREPRIGMATSTDGRTWHRHGNPVLEPGPRGSWDERGVADPYVIRAGGKLYLFYLGQDRARRQRLGVAVSSEGLRWSKLRSNPILELGGSGDFDENGLGEPAVWDANGYYWMLYTGRDKDEVRRIGMARSQNGVHWEKLDKVFAGTQAWNKKVVSDPTVLAAADGLHVWFGGGDVARPDENIHGQIGFAILK